MKALPHVIGARRWALAEGYLPEWSHGPPQKLGSHETLCLLNAGPRVAHVTLTLFFSDREPLGPYRTSVPARRTTHLRLDALDDPAPVPRGVDFSTLVESDVPIVVQQTRLDSRQAENALMTTIGYPG